MNADRGITRKSVSDTLSELFAMSGLQQYISSENGSETIAQNLDHCLKQTGVQTLYIKPESPLGNGDVKSLNELFSNKFLATEIFQGLGDA